MTEIKKILQDTIEKLAGVINAAVIVKEDQISEIHVLTDRSRHPKQISRDVQSIYTARFGEVLDRKLISIAQIESDTVTKKYSRILLDEVKYQVGADANAHVQVTLRHGDDTCTGALSGVHTTRNAQRLVVAATLESLEEMLDLSQKIILEDIQRLRLAGQEVYTVALCALNDQSEEIHVGSAIVKGEDKEALVRATLDALNRRIDKLVK